MADGFCATIKVLIRADDKGTAEDALAELLRFPAAQAAQAPEGTVVDWCYLSTKHPVTAPDCNGYCTPTECDIPDDYDEGAAFEHPECDVVQTHDPGDDGFSRLFDNEPIS